MCNADVVRDMVSQFDLDKDDLLDSSIGGAVRVIRDKSDKKSSVRPFPLSCPCSFSGPALSGGEWPHVEMGGDRRRGANELPNSPERRLHAQLQDRCQLGQVPGIVSLFRLPQSSRNTNKSPTPS